MQLSRREFLYALGLAGAAGMLRPSGARAMGWFKDDAYAVPDFGNVSLMHFTDCHAQLNPVHFREPNINLGVGSLKGEPPHLVTDAFLEYYGIEKGSKRAHAFTPIDYVEGAQQYGKMGGFAHMKTLVDRFRSEREGKTLLLDGGDTWQGSATSLWTDGMDMVKATNKLGVDVMTGHWEFTYGADRVRELIEGGHLDMDFVAHNISDVTWGDRVDLFEPYTIKERNGVRIAVIGQAFPFTPIANPSYKIPDWSFGVDEDHAQKVVDEIRDNDKADVVVILSHNGMDVDKKMASRLRGVDVILGGHTHDAMPTPMEIKNKGGGIGGMTLVVNSGSNGKFLSRLDFDVKNGKVRDYRFHMLPIFSNEIDADPEMQQLIDEERSKAQEQAGKDLSEELAVSEDLLYRRGNFNGTFDQLIVEALMESQDAEVALSPGFRWGTSVLPGQPITLEDVYTQTAITYPEVTLNDMTGEQLKFALEDVAENLFNPDPYYQQGGDMVRVGGLQFAFNPREKQGNRLQDIEINGEPLDPKKKYKVAGWASVSPVEEDRPPVYDVVSDWLRDKKSVSVGEPNLPRLKGVKDNPGLDTDVRLA
ncbi:5'-nucleotidase [Thiohalorhabdus denitrificans]|uniref:Sulfate thiol esterase SoxB n=1 Tax=Thiohalorhabdus denitrificans TaxID=381306 RepID=A0A0P9EFF6_9GAMM|nr:thiosulfohydrolase SoxB [Thiohalorhabdus denitrificans]KPV41111.1 5'-nucleotidase [Thiohalorhabdus denitrificans]SCY38003.1 sulfate thiol esterase SoxB [Thiohalorhabdus denitrificans]